MKQMITVTDAETETEACEVMRLFCFDSASPEDMSGRSLYSTASGFTVSLP